MFGGCFRGRSFKPPSVRTSRLELGSELRSSKVRSEARGRTVRRTAAELSNCCLNGVYQQISRTENTKTNSERREHLPISIHRRFSGSVADQAPGLSEHHFDQWLGIWLEEPDATSDGCRICIAESARSAWQNSCRPPLRATKRRQSRLEASPKAAAILASVLRVTLVTLHTLVCQSKMPERRPTNGVQRTASNERHPTNGIQR